MTLAYSFEPVTREVLAEVQTLAVPHLAEVGVIPGATLCIDVDGYMRISEMGMIRFYTVRDDGLMVGYASHVIRPHPHMMGETCAAQDAVYVVPDYRGECGRALLDFADRELMAEGVKAIFRTSTVKRNFVPLLERMGYEMHEFTMVLRPKHDGH